MNIALLTYNFYPMHDGISQVFTSLNKCFQNLKHNLFIFNVSYQDGKKIFNVLDTQKYYRPRDMIIYFRNKELGFCLIRSIYKLLLAKQMSISDKIIIIFYLLKKPEFSIKILKNILYIYPYFKKIKFDLIIGGSVLLNTIGPSFLLSKIFNTKVFALAHGNDMVKKTRLAFKTRIIRDIDRIIVSGAKMKKTMKRIHNLDDQKIDIIHYGLILNDYDIKKSKEDLRKEFNLEQDDFILLSVGHHRPRKNFDLVIKAISKIKQKNPNIKIKYFLIGTGNTTPLYKKLTRDFDLGDLVKFLGDCDNNTRNKYLKLSDAFVMPSIVVKNSIEGFGIVFLEANYFNLPVIGSNKGGVPEAIEDGKTGFLINPKSLDELVEKIEFLYRNKECRILMGEKGKKRVINDFNWKYILKDYLNLFENILNT